MQRFFSMFPGGAAGCGMLILRIGVAASLHIDASGHFGVNPNMLVFVGLAVLSGSLAVGLLTPLASILAGLVEVTLLLTAATSILALVVLGPLDAAVLLLLGPGAYSLDARLFGRRVVVLQPGRPTLER